MIVHVHVEKADILGTAIIGVLHGFADRGRPHHGTDPRIIKIVAVFHSMIASGKDNQVVTAQAARSAQEKSDPLGRKGMRPV